MLKTKTNRYAVFQIELVMKREGCDVSEPSTESSLKPGYANPDNLTEAQSCSKGIRIMPSLKNLDLMQK